MSNKNKAIALIINSALFFALMSVLIKLSGNLPSVEKVFFRNLITLIIASILIVKTKSPIFGHKGNRIVLLFRVISGTLGAVSSFYAINHLVLADANMLQQMGPFFAIILASLILKEKITKQQVFIMILAFIGGIFVIRPSLNATVIPSLVGLLAAFFLGAAYTFLRYLGNKETSETIVFDFAIFSVIAVFPFMMMYYVKLNIYQLLYLFIAGIFAAIGQFSMTLACKLAEPKEISIYAYTQIIFVTLLGYFIFDEIPSKWSFIGYFLIIVASISMYIYNRKLKKEI